MWFLPTTRNSQDRSRHREGLILEFIREDLNDYAKHIQGSMDDMREQAWNFSRDGNFFCCFFFFSGVGAEESRKSKVSRQRKTLFVGVWLLTWEQSLLTLCHYFMPPVVMCDSSLLIMKTQKQRNTKEKKAKQFLGWRSQWSKKLGSQQNPGFTFFVLGGDMSVILCNARIRWWSVPFFPQLWRRHSFKRADAPQESVWVPKPRTEINIYRYFENIRFSLQLFFKTCNRLRFIARGICFLYKPIIRASFLKFSRWSPPSLFYSIRSTVMSLPRSVKGSFWYHWKSWVNYFFPKLHSSLP